MYRFRAIWGQSGAQSQKTNFFISRPISKVFFSLESLWNFQQRILARTCSFSNLLRAKVVLFSTNEISVSSKLLCQTYYCVHFRSVSTLVDHCGHIMVHSAKLFILVCRSWIQKCFIQLNWNFKIRLELVMSGYLLFFSNFAMCPEYGTLIFIKNAIFLECRTVTQKCFIQLIRNFIIRLE